MTLGEIIRRVQNAVGDEAGVILERLDLVDYINDAQVDICRKTGILRGTNTFSTVGSTEDYPLPVDFIEVVRVTYQGNKIQKISWQEIDQIDPSKDQGTSQGVPSYYHREGNRLFLYPVPASAAANGVKVYYIRTPVALAADGDIPEIPLQFHEDIVTYTIAKSREQIEDYQAALSKWAEYKERMTLTKEQSQEGSDESYPVIRDIDPWYA